ncbi:PepSY domain-containing protein [Actinoplanes solisilvae]|uniref:PepSY domain-containing protein n=1 Tax=Actinoplanes solisilvae TaxID=2486853 RepID=UPI000FDC2957|nr:PepSY domain-containing protein [Actinoplanes solisilvae]
MQRGAIPDGAMLQASDRNTDLEDPMKRSYMIAAAIGAAAVIAVTGTALAAADDSSTPTAGPTSTASPSDDSATPTDDSATPTDDSSSPPSSDPTESPLPFETVEPGSVTPTPRSSSSATSGLGSPATSSVSAEQARAKALSVVGGGRVTKVEAETEHGRPVWEVEVIHKGIEHDLDIDRRTGAVTDHDRDHDDDGRGRGHGGHDDD